MFCLRCSTEKYRSLSLMVFNGRENGVIIPLGYCYPCGDRWPQSISSCLGQPSCASCIYLGEVTGFQLKRCMDYGIAPAVIGAVGIRNEKAQPDLGYAPKSVRRQSCLGRSIFALDRGE